MTSCKRNTHSANLKKYCHLSQLKVSRQRMVMYILKCLTCYMICSCLILAFFHFVIFTQQLRLDATLQSYTICFLVHQIRKFSVRMYCPWKIFCDKTLWVLLIQGVLYLSFLLYKSSSLITIFWYFVILLFWSLAFVTEQQKLAVFCQTTFV